MNTSTTSLRDYFKLANIFKSNSSKKKTNLVEMIVYGCITNKINKIEDISMKEANEILKENKIVLRSLPGYGSVGLKKKAMKPTKYDENNNNVMHY